MNLALAPRSRQPWLLMVVLWTLLLSGCAVSFVAEYDKASEEKLIATYEKVNRLYDALAEAAPAERSYDKSAKAWADIATDLRVLALRQKARVSNAESQKIVDMMVANWEQARARHKQRSADPERRANAYPDSLIALDRAQFDAQFAAAVAAEVFKK